MTTKEEFWDYFLEFEKNKNLFALKDSFGTYYWDIIRYDIYSRLLWKDNPIPEKTQKQKGFGLLKIKSLLSFLKICFLFRKKEIFFYLTSRNKEDKGGFIDQNAKDVYELFPTKDVFSIESFFSKGSGMRDSYLLPQLVYRKLHRKYSFDLSYLIDILEKEFGTLNFTHDDLVDILNHFYADFFFFYKLFKRSGVKKIFITQNGIQKALFKAAKELGIQTFEFQHGNIDSGHLAYNYPRIEYSQEQIYLPNVILSLSPFWFNEVFLPDVKIQSIGNNYFYAPLGKVKNISCSDKAITVVSSDVFGKELLNFITELRDFGGFDRYKIYFKLHPNQFCEKEYYQRKLSLINNVQVITNEKTVADLLSESNTVLAVQSTAIYETLQAQKKVILLKRSSYKRHEHVFEHPNLYVVDNKYDFLSALQTEIDVNYNIEFFSPFDKKEFLKVYYNG